MSSRSHQTDDRGPFIADQSLHLLREQQQSRKYVCGSAFAAERRANGDRRQLSGSMEELMGHWDAVPRDRVASNNLENTPLDRTVIVNDSGVGKSTTAHWLRYEYCRPGSDQLAFCIEISQLKRLAEIETHVARPNKLSETFVETILL